MVEQRSFVESIQEAEGGEEPSGKTEVPKPRSPGFHQTFPDVCFSNLLGFSQAHQIDNKD